MATTSSECDPCGTSEESPSFLAYEELSALRLEAIAILNQKNSDQYSSEHFSIEQASLGTYGAPHHALRNLIVHLPNHSGKSIVKAYAEATRAGRKAEVIMTDEHITVCRDLTHSWDVLRGSGVTSSTPTATVDEFKRIRAYALDNVEYGQLIISLYRERGIHTLQEILDFLPTLKETGHTALSEGSL